jgi:hypothetical protein
MKRRTKLGASVGAVCLSVEMVVVGCTSTAPSGPYMLFLMYEVDG